MRTALLESVADKNQRGKENAAFGELILNLEMLCFKYTSRWHLNKLDAKKGKIYIQQGRTGKASLAYLPEISAPFLSDSFNVHIPF